MKRPTRKQKKIGRDEGWEDFEIEHGYGEFENETDYGTVITVICRIDCMETFDGDDEAVEQAKEDGYKFLFTNVIDTPENREAVKEFTKEDKEEWY